MAMGVTNTIMVGHLGGTPLAAAGLGAGLYFMLLVPCQGLLEAISPLVAHAIGADDHPTAARVAGAGLIVAAVLAAPAVALFTAIPVLLPALGYEAALTQEIGAFMHSIRWGAPAFLGAVVLRFLLVAAFRPRVVMVSTLCAIPVNAALNWVLIFGHSGLPRRGAAASGG